MKHLKLNLFAAAFFLVSTAGAQTLKISQLPPITNAEVTTSDVLPIVDTSLGVTKKITIGEIDSRYSPLLLPSAQIFVGNVSGTATARALSGDASLSNVGVMTIANSAITNAKVSASAAIDYSKLNLVGSIANADVSASAAISYSKLASLSTGQLLVGNAGVPTATILSGDATIGATGVLTLNTVSAAKGGTGQTTFTTGDILVASGTTSLVKVAASTSGYGLQTNGAGTIPTWVPKAQGSLSILTASSATKTPVATSQYHALSGNSLSLAAGTTYLMWGYCSFGQSGGAIYTLAACGFTASNGADSAATPTALSTAVTVNSAVQLLGVFNVDDNLGAGSFVETLKNTGNLVVTTSGTTTVYLVTYANMTTPANARISVSLNALKLY